MTEPVKKDEIQDEATEEGSVSTLDNVRRLLPVHAAPTVGGKSKGGTTLKVERKRGRPRKVERMPTTSDLEYHAEIADTKQQFIEQDKLVQAARKNADPQQILALIKEEVAVEAASLHFQRLENEKFGKDTSQNSSRRIDALTKIANIELEIKKLGGTLIDLKSEQMQKVFAFWVETLRDITQETLTPEQIDIFFNRLETKLQGWEDRASDLIR